MSLNLGTSLVVQWLRLCLAMEEEGSIPRLGTKLPLTTEQLSPSTTTKSKHHK